MKFLLRLHLQLEIHSFSSFLVWISTDRFDLLIFLLYLSPNCCSVKVNRQKLMLIFLLNFKTYEIWVRVNRNSSELCLLLFYRRCSCQRSLLHCQLFWRNRQLLFLFFQRYLANSLRILASLVAADQLI